jgi:hypothetical protein
LVFFTKEVRSHECDAGTLAGPAGFEPATSWLTATRRLLTPPRPRLAPGARIERADSALTVQPMCQHMNPGTRRRTFIRLRLETARRSRTPPASSRLIVKDRALSSQSVPGERIELPWAGSEPAVLATGPTRNASRREAPGNRTLPGGLRARCSALEPTPRFVLWEARGSNPPLSD